MDVKREQLFTWHKQKTILTLSIKKFEKTAPDCYYLSCGGNKEIDPIYNSIKNKMVRNKFKQEVKDLYSEKYKTLMKEINEDKNNWNGILLMDWKDIVKMSIYKNIYKFNIILTKIMWYFLQKQEKQS